MLCFNTRLHCFFLEIKTVASNSNLLKFVSDYFPFPAHDPMVCLVLVLVLDTVSGPWSWSLWWTYETISWPLWRTPHASLVSLIYLGEYFLVPLTNSECFSSTSKLQYAAANSSVASRRSQQSNNLIDINKHFPSMRCSLTSLSANDRKPSARCVIKRNVFKTKPRSHEVLNNVLAFPPLSIALKMAKCSWKHENNIKSIKYRRGIQSNLLPPR